jgi:hypothetical protein
MNIMLQGFFHHEREVGTFCAIAIVVFAFVFVLFKSIGKHLPGLVNLHPDLGKVGQLHWGAILIDQGFNINAVELKITIPNIKAFLGKIKRLFYEVAICVVHLIKH